MSRNKKNYFTPEGLSKIADIVRCARTNLDLGLEEFGEKVGVSYGTIWQIENKKTTSIALETLIALAPHTAPHPDAPPYSLNELIVIGTGIPIETVKNNRQYILAEEAWLLMQKMSASEMFSLLVMVVRSATFNREQWLQLLRAVTDRLSHTPQ